MDRRLRFGGAGGVGRRAGGVALAEEEGGVWVVVKTDPARMRAVYQRLAGRPAQG